MIEKFHINSGDTILNFIRVRWNCIKYCVPRIRCMQAYRSDSEGMKTESLKMLVRKPICGNLVPTGVFLCGVNPMKKGVVGYG